MTTKYLKITNRVDNVSRVALEKLGLSSKRNDPNTIGQFGSGIKFAPIAALREGLEWYFTGHDNNGEYKMKYSTEIEDGIECVVYDYGTYKKASSFTVDAGCLSWVNNFQIYREAVANAIDEAGSDGYWSITLVNEDEIVPTEGEFSVFITASPGIMEIHNNFDKFFCVERTPVHSLSIGGVYTNVQLFHKIDQTFRVYSHGVLVYSDDSTNSCFDYNIDNLELNEERTIKSSWDLEWIVANILTNLSDHTIIEKITEAGMTGKHYFEFDKMYTHLLEYREILGNWCDWFIVNHGDRYVLHDETSALHNIDTTIKLKGYTPVCIPNDNFYKFLVKAGNRDYKFILGENFDIKADHEYQKYKNVAIAVEIAKHYIPDFQQVVDSGRFGVYESDIQHNLGLTVNMKSEVSERKIYIHHSHVNDTVENILATIVHEYDHLSTGIADGDYLSFRDIADRRIASLMIQNYRSSFFLVRDGNITFPIASIGNELSDLNFALIKVPGADMIIAIIGGKTIKINSDAKFRNENITDTINGVLSPIGNARSLTIDGLENVLEADLVG